MAAIQNDPDDLLAAFDAGLATIPVDEDERPAAPVATQPAGALAPEPVPPEIADLLAPAPEPGEEETAPKRRLFVSVKLWIVGGIVGGLVLVIGFAAALLLRGAADSSNASEPTTQQAAQAGEKAAEQPLEKPDEKPSVKARAETTPSADAVQGAATPPGAEEDERAKLARERQEFEAEKARFEAEKAAAAQGAASADGSTAARPAAGDCRLQGDSKEIAENLRSCLKGLK